MQKKSLQELLSFHTETMKTNDRIFRNCPWENPEFYANWCGQNYYFVTHATRILAASASRMQLDRDDAHIRFLDHSQEEKRHEKLYENDLQMMGQKIAQFQEHPLTSFLYQCQYYLLDYKDAMAPLGGVFYLEGVSVYSGNMILERCIKAHGEKACSFLKVHIHDDQDHLKKAEDLLSKLSSPELSVVFESYRQFSYSYMQLMLHLHAMIGSQQKSA